MVQRAPRGRHVGVLGATGVAACRRRRPPCPTPTDDPAHATPATDAAAPAPTDTAAPRPHRHRRPRPPPTRCRPASSCRRRRCWRPTSKPSSGPRRRSPPSARKSGADTKLVQQRLLDLGFWNTGPDGKYGFATTQAVMAFQKYNGLKPTGSVDKGTAFAMTFATEKAHGQTNAGNVVEVDKARQVLFIVQDGKTVWAFNTSTGSGIPYRRRTRRTRRRSRPATRRRPNGLYTTNRQRPEGWWEGDLGKIYRPKYFNGGIAVHGMTSVPNHPASHGCVRLSTMAMDMIWDQNLIPLHTTVWVHE